MDQEEKSCNGEVMDLEEKSCNEEETVKALTYIIDMMSASGGCKADLTAKTRCGWAKLRECGELLHGTSVP